MDDLKIPKVMRNGQICLPNHWLKKLGLKEGDRIIIQLIDDKILIHKLNIINYLAAEGRRDVEGIKKDISDLKQELASLVPRKS